MDLAAVFILALLGGYAFFTRWHVTSFHAKRAEGQRLYLEAALIGARLFVLALVLHVVGMTYWDAYASGFGGAAMAAADSILEEPHGTVQVHLVVAAVYSVPLGAALATLLNLRQPRELALRRSLSALDAYLRDAQLAEVPVAVTLTTGKVYIGYVMQITDPDRPPPAIVLLPVFSGHRDPAGRLTLTTDYLRFYEALSADSDKAAELDLPEDWQSRFEIVLRADQIVSANMFSPTVYSEFNPGWRETIETRDRPPPRQEVLVEIKPSHQRPWYRRGSP